MSQVLYFLSAGLSKRITRCDGEWYSIHAYLSGLYSGNVEPATDGQTGEENI